MMNSRRSFFKEVASATLATGFYSAVTKIEKAGIAPSPAKATIPISKISSDLKVGIAGFTFSKSSLETAISIMKRVEITNMSLKDNFLSLGSSEDKITAVVNQFNTAGIQLYAVGVIYMKTEAEVDRAFDYARKVGARLIIAAPEYSLLSYAESKVKSTKIRLAIHNHGPEDKLYPSPEDVWKRINNMDSGMGLCIDIGHSMRAGTNPAEAVLKYKSRLFDLHIKDVTGAFKDARPIELGRGVINFPELIMALKKIDYSGMCSHEHEKDMTDLLPGLSESAGFFKGVMRTT